MADKASYISNYAKFESRTGNTGPTWIRDIRRTAIDQFGDQGFPTVKDETWRHTRIRPLLQHDFKVVDGYKQTGLGANQIEALSFADHACERITFVNGHFAEDLSSIRVLPQGVEVTSLRAAVETHPDLVRRYLARHAETGANPFVALNTAHLLDGAFVYVPTKTVVDKPIHLLFIATAADEAVVSHPRNLIVVEESSQATILEDYVSTQKNVYFTNAVTEIVVSDHADVDHYKVQRESESAYHIASTQAYMGRDSRFHTDFVSMGGGLVRNDVATVLDGEGIECTVDGLYMADRHQHVDNHTTIEHVQPNCDSHELYKGVLGGRARAVFNGKIHVHQDAQKTDAKQSNGCMLLSEDAQINTNPQLEIYADDVKCTHGAVVGQLDPNAVFYLQSRCIDAAQARTMLIYAFANEVLERMKVDALRVRLECELFGWLARAQKS